MRTLRRVVSTFGSRVVSARQRRALVWFEWALLGALVLLFVDKGLLRGWKDLNSDFPNYLVAAKLLRSGIPLDRAYDWTWFQRQKDHMGIDWGVVGYIPHPPFSALLFEPLAGLLPLTAKRVWLVVNLGLIAGTLAILRTMTRMPMRRLAIIVFLTTVPLQTSFQFGQQHILVLFLLTGAAWLYLRDRDFACGAVVALAAAIKLYPALFGLFFLVKRRWNALVGLAATGAALLVVAVPLFGIETLRVYATEVIPRSLVGELNDPYYAGFNTPAVLLRRLFIAEPGMNPHPLVNLPALYVVLQPLLAAATLVSALWFINRSRACERERISLEIGAFVALLLVLSTGSSTYHFCALILATTLAVDFLLRARRPGLAALLVGLHALVSAPLYRFALKEPSGAAIFLGFTRLYALLAYWGVFLWVLARVEPPPGQRPRDARLLYLAFAVITLSGIRSNARHYDGQMDGPGDRLPLTKDAFVVTAPAPTPDGTYCSRMADEGYVLDRTGGGLVTETARGTDLFHPAFAADGTGWVEVASKHSRIARLLRGTSLIVPSAMPTEIADGEQPAVTPDGHWLGFLREGKRARGTLWVADRRAAAASAREVEVSPDDLDVFDFSFFPDGRVVMAARHDDGPSLYVTGPTPGPAIPIPTTDQRARYPAVSPDGRWLAYSGEEKGAWQLHVLNLATKEDRRLTHADCNAITPAWMSDSETVVYASDCGRNLGNTTLFRMRVGQVMRR
jgi:hypothetical protein